jgi:hypothetical protein
LKYLLVKRIILYIKKPSAVGVHQDMTVCREGGRNLLETFIKVTAIKQGVYQSNLKHTMVLSPPRRGGRI